VLNGYPVLKSTDFKEVVEKEAWLESTKLVVKPDMLFGRRGKSGLVVLYLDLALVQERLGCTISFSEYGRIKIEENWVKVKSVFIEMNPFTLVNGDSYPLDMRGELDDTAAFKNFKNGEISGSHFHWAGFLVPQKASSIILMKREVH
jgi:ATP citrate (pro-S)-lyase